MTQADIYKKLKALRKERGLTLATLADKIGSDYQQLSRIERGKSRLTVDVLMKMADAFDTPINELIKQPSKQIAPAQTSLDTPQLSEILEKVEAVLHETGGKISAQVKASIISSLYKEALSHPQSVDFALSILKTYLKGMPYST